MYSYKPQDIKKENGYTEKTDYGLTQLIISKYLIMSK